MKRRTLILGRHFGGWLQRFQRFQRLQWLHHVVVVWAAVFARRALRGFELLTFAFRGFSLPFGERWTGCCHGLPPIDKRAGSLLPFKFIRFSCSISVRGRSQPEGLSAPARHRTRRRNLQEASGTRCPESRKSGRTDRPRSRW